MIGNEKEFPESLEERLKTMEEEIEIEVEQGTYVRTSAPNSPYSGGVGPCVVAGAIYGKEGYMVHGVPGIIEGKLEEMLDDLKKDVKNKTKLRIYIIGGCPTYLSVEELRSLRLNKEKFSNEFMNDKNALVDRIRGAGFDEAIKKIRWCPRFYIQELIFNLANGKVKIVEEECREI